MGSLGSLTASEITDYNGVLIWLSRSRKLLAHPAQTGLALSKLILVACGAGQRMGKESNACGVVQQA